MEAMTLTQALQIAKGLTGHHQNGMASDAAWRVIEAHLTQPAQAVDVGVRRICQNSAESAEVLTNTSKSQASECRHILVPTELPKNAVEILAYFDAEDVGNSRYEAAEECWGQVIAEAAKAPPVLQFTRHIFKPGRNITVRYGRKWERVPYALIDLGDDRPSMLAALSTLTYYFHQLTDHMLRDEHDPSCRSVDGLFAELSRVYPGFERTDEVTLVSFYLPEYALPTPPTDGEE